MTQVSILGPPRNGRKVLTEKECLEDIASWPRKQGKSTDAPILKSKTIRASPKKSSRSVKRSANDYFLYPGRFEVGSIDESQDFFVFRDLKLPMGSWKELGLCPYIDDTSKKAFEDWDELNDMDLGMPPADIWYGLAAVCYLNKDKWDLASQIQTRVFVPDTLNFHPYTATQVCHRENAPDLVKVGFGWGSKHPFRTEYYARIGGSNNVIVDPTVRADASMESALLGLIGENDPGRCKKVLEWAMGSSPALFFRDFDSPQSPVTFYRHDRTFPALNATSDGKIQRPRRLILADPSDYSRQ